MHDEPSAEVIARLKEKHPDRALHLVTMTHCEQTHHFVMSGANHYEYKKFQDEVLEAGDKAKNSADKLEKLTLAIKTAALAQIRWPDRTEVDRVFMENPGLIPLFSDKINEHAGSSAEVRSKKL
jgi:DNA-binding NarL/FixJ family response regulator